MNDKEIKKLQDKCNEFGMKSMKLGLKLIAASAVLGLVYLML